MLKAIVYGITPKESPNSIIARGIAKNPAFGIEMDIASDKASSKSLWIALATANVAIKTNAMWSNEIANIATNSISELAVLTLMNIVIGVAT
jgi:hypothetical protein